MFAGRVPWRQLRWPVALATALVLSGPVVGCNGNGGGEPESDGTVEFTPDEGGELTLEEYFSRLEPILEDDGVRTAEAVGSGDIWQGGGYAYEVDCCYSSDEARAFMDAIVAIHSDTLSAVQELDPQAEAQAAQDEFVAVLDGLIATGKEIGAFVATVEFTEGLYTPRDAGLIGVSDEVSVAFDRYHDLSHQRSQTCAELIVIVAPNTDFVYSLCPQFD